MHPAQKLGLLSLVVFASGWVVPFLLYGGQDPAGQAMMGGLLAFLFWGVALVLAIVAFVKSFRGDPGKAAKVFGRAPLFLIVLLVVVGLVLAINS